MKEHSIEPVISDGAKTSTMRDKLNLGCGRKHLPDAVNLDLVAGTKPDIVHDLNVRPWPFAPNTFAEVNAYDVVEHLDDIVGAMEEIHRICRPGAIVRITVPHFSCANAFTDPTHKHFFSSNSFAYFTGDHEFDFYTKVRFKTRRIEIVFYPSLLNKLVLRLANKWTQAYERRYAWLFPAWFIFFELEVLKTPV